MSKRKKWKKRFSRIPQNRLDPRLVGRWRKRSFDFLHIKVLTKREVLIPNMVTKIAYNLRPKVNVEYWEIRWQTFSLMYQRLSNKSSDRDPQHRPCRRLHLHATLKTYMRRIWKCYFFTVWFGSPQSVHLTRTFFNMWFFEEIWEILPRFYEFWNVVYHLLRALICRGPVEVQDPQTNCLGG